MSGRQAKNESLPGRNSVGTDWFHPVDGGSVPVSGDTADGSKTGDQPRGLIRITKETNEDGDLYSLVECKDGVCPVPWATTPARPELQPDLVNHPPHYTDGGIECIEAIEAQLTPEEFRGYLKGNCVKYLWRERHKGGTESLKKASWYIDRLVQFDEVNQNG